MDKTQVINTLSSNLSGKDEELKSLKDIIKTVRVKALVINFKYTLFYFYQNEADLMTYRTELSELHVKFQAHNGPFNLTAKYNSEEYQKSLQEKISKLEDLLEDERKKREHYV